MEVQILKTITKLYNQFVKERSQADESISEESRIVFLMWNQAQSCKLYGWLIVCC